MIHIKETFLKLEGFFHIYSVTEVKYILCFWDYSKVNY